MDDEANIKEPPLKNQSTLTNNLINLPNINNSNSTIDLTSIITPENQNDTTIYHPIKSNFETSTLLSKLPIVGTLFSKGGLTSKLPVLRHLISAEDDSFLVGISALLNGILLSLKKDRRGIIKGILSNLSSTVFRGIPLVGHLLGGNQFQSNGGSLLSGIPIAGDLLNNLGLKL